MQKIKSIAMVVRFITRRFIGDYDPNLEKVYTHNTVIDNDVVLFEILDATGQMNVSTKQIQKRFKHLIGEREKMKESCQIFVCPFCFFLCLSYRKRTV